MDPIKGRIPPQILDAEMYLIAAILIRPEALHDIMGFFREEYFYAEKLHCLNPVVSTNALCLTRQILHDNEVNFGQRSVYKFPTARQPGQSNGKSRILSL